MNPPPGACPYPDLQKDGGLTWAGWLAFCVLTAIAFAGWWLIDPPKVRAGDMNDPSNSVPLALASKWMRLSFERDQEANQPKTSKEDRRFLKGQASAYAQCAKELSDVSIPPGPPPLPGLPRVTCDEAHAGGSFLPKKVPTEVEKDAEYLRDHPNARIDDKVNYRTGKGIPVRENGGQLYDCFGKLTPYQKTGNPNMEPIRIKEGPDCE